MLSVTVKRTSIFLNIEPVDSQTAGPATPGARLKYLRDIGAFFGGMLGIFSGFVLSFITKLGSLPISNMLLCWVAIGLAAAIVGGSLSTVWFRLLQFKRSSQESHLSGTTFQPVR